jgi:hypothetical protein
MSGIAACVLAVRNVPFLSQSIFHVLHDFFYERLHFASQIYSEMADGQEGCSIEMSERILPFCHFLWIGSKLTSIPLARFRQLTLQMSHAPMQEEFLKCDLVVCAHGRYERDDCSSDQWFPMVLVFQYQFAGWLVVLFHKLWTRAKSESASLKHWLEHNGQTHHFGMIQEALQGQKAPMNYVLTWSGLVQCPFRLIQNLLVLFHLEIELSRMYEFET